MHGAVRHSETNIHFCADLLIPLRLLAQVVFGHCISDCSGTGSNVNAGQAVQITSDLRVFNGGEFACNGGAFFWVAVHDVGGEWSDAVVTEVRKTAGCSKEDSPPPVPVPCVDGSPAYKFAAMTECEGGVQLDEDQCEALASFMGFNYKGSMPFIEKDPSAFPGGCFVKFWKNKVFYNSGKEAGLGCSRKKRCVCGADEASE